MSEFRRNECVNCHTQFPAYCAYCPECGFKQSSSVELTQASPGKADAASDGVHSGTERQGKGTPSTSNIEFGPTESLSTRLVATDVPAQQLEDAITHTKESGAGSDHHKPCCSQNRTKQTGELQMSTPNAADLLLTVITNFKHKEESQASDCAHLSKAPSLTSDDQQVCCTVHARTNV